MTSEDNNKNKIIVLKLSNVYLTMNVEDGRIWKLFTSNQQSNQTSNELKQVIIKAFNQEFHSI